MNTTKTLILTVFLMCGLHAIAQDKIANPNFDETLAQKYEADDYGMRSYFLVILKTGKNKSQNQELLAKSMRGHLDNIKRLVENGKLVVAGPLGTNQKNYRGIFIFQGVESQEKLEAILATDQAIKNNFLAYEIYPWYGSAALPAYLPISDKIWKKKP